MSVAAFVAEKPGRDKVEAICENLAEVEALREIGGGVVGSVGGGLGGPGGGGWVETRGRKQEVSSTSMLTALNATLTMEAAAAVVGCSAPLFTVRAKSDPIVAAGISAQDHRRENSLAESILRHRGVLSRVADEVGLGSPQAVRYHISRSVRLQQAFENSRDRIVDKAEDNVFLAVEGGSVDDSWKLLKTLGKNRGYAERREIESHVEHRFELKSSGELLNLLNSLAKAQPQAVEAEFSVLSPSDQELLSSALQRLSTPAAEVVEVVEEEGTFVE